MATGFTIRSSSMLPPRTSTSTLDSRSSGSSRSPSPYGRGHDIQLINTIPGALPRSSAPTRQRLLYVAASLSIHLTNADLPHAFLGHFSLFLRGADVAPRWVDADVIKPIIGATQRVKDVLALHKDFAIHGEAHEDGTDRLLVSHSCGIYVRLSVGAIPSLKKKVDLISAHLDASQPTVVLPCLTPARQFLETVIVASSMNAKVEDLQDLVWMKDNLKMDMMNDPTTLKKTWDDGRLGKLLEHWPAMKGVFVDLGLVVDGAEVRSTVPSTLNRSRSKYGH